MRQSKFRNTARIVTFGIALSCFASAQYSEWHPVANSKGLTWRWRGQESAKTCEIEIRESEKLRLTTANLTLDYLFSDHKRKIGHNVTFMNSDVAVFHLDSCQRVDSVVADRVRRK